MNHTQKIDSIIKELTALKIELDVVQCSTPCTDQGYTVGDVFIIENNYGGSGDAFGQGSIVELYEDDGTTCPKFKLLKGTCRWNNADGESGAFTSMRNVRKIAP
jgi:hypothetical protein